MTARARRIVPTGFTLMEMLITVVILGVLAAIVIPGVTASQNEAAQNIFVEDIKVFGQAAELFRFDTGQYPEDAATGTVPTGFESYIDEKVWTALTPIGGAWDAEFESYGIKSALGVDFANGGGEDRDDTYMLRVDQLMDDGDLTTGGFRKLDAGRYYNVLADL
ncbi:MAG: type II secretion system protein [Planctomycetota bacterium]